MPSDAHLLKEINDRVEAGQEPLESVRTLLSWYGAYRRGWRQVASIRDDLQEFNLETVPDFESPHIDSLIRFRRKPASPPAATVPQEAAQGNVAGPPTTPPDGATATDTAAVIESATIVRQAEPAHQISRLRSASNPPVWVTPDTTVAEAITKMLALDFSQLPVMQSERDPKGLFSWKSYGSRLALGRECKVVRTCMDGYKELGSEASLYDAIPLIVQNECVLIRDGTRKICGIVTPADLSAQFQELSEPFLLLSAIENLLRAWMAAKFTVEDLQAAKDPNDEGRHINDVSDLTYGGYVRLLEKPIMWAKLGTLIDRSTFTARLDKIRTIRNDVMHFDPDPLDPSDLETLRRFAQFLERLERIRAE